MSDSFPDPSRPDSEILTLQEINLTRNYFLFDSRYILQIKGTAMGKSFAPFYANIFYGLLGRISPCPIFSTPSGPGAIPDLFSATVSEPSERLEVETIEK